MTTQDIAAKLRKLHGGLRKKNANPPYNGLN